MKITIEGTLEELNQAGIVGGNGSTYNAANAMVAAALIPNFIDLIHGGAQRRKGEAEDDDEPIESE